MLAIHYNGVITCRLKTIEKAIYSPLLELMRYIYTVSHTLILVAPNLVLVVPLFKEDIYKCIVSRTVLCPKRLTWCSLRLGRYKEPKRTVCVQVAVKEKK